MSARFGALVLALGLCGCNVWTDFPEGPLQGVSVEDEPDLDGGPLGDLGPDQDADLADLKPGCPSFEAPNSPVRVANQPVLDRPERHISMAHVSGGPVMIGWQNDEEFEIWLLSTAEQPSLERLAIDTDAMIPDGLDGIALGATSDTFGLLVVQSDCDQLNEQRPIFGLRSRSEQGAFVLESKSVPCPDFTGFVLPLINGGYNPLAPDELALHWVWNDLEGFLSVTRDPALAYEDTDQHVLVPQPPGRGFSREAQRISTSGRLLFLRGSSGLYWFDPVTALESEQPGDTVLFDLQASTGSPTFDIVHLRDEIYLSAMADEGQIMLRQHAYDPQQGQIVTTPVAQGSMMVEGGTALEVELTTFPEGLAVYYVVVDSDGEVLEARIHASLIDFIDGKVVLTSRGIAELEPPDNFVSTNEMVAVRDGCDALAVVASQTGESFDTLRILTVETLRWRGWFETTN